MYNAYGLSFTEKKVRYDYIVYDNNVLPDMDWHSKNIDKKFFIRFDPEDMGLIFLYEKDSTGNLKFVKEARTKVEIARGKQEQTQSDHSYIADMKKLNDRARLDRINKMEKILVEQNMSAEQYGLNKPKILGLNSKRKKSAKNDSFGQLLKAESEITPVAVNQQDDNEDFDIYKNM